MEEGIYPCPACGFLVFDEPPGSYAICPVCEWEDDHIQLKHPAMSGGANSISLLEHQRKLLNVLPATLREFDGYKRAPDWRALIERDCADSLEPPNSGLDYFKAAAEPSPGYYWQEQIDD
ncbi:MAG: CPCC family cysteine-rich protein [Acidobacteriota bacterium]